MSAPTETTPVAKSLHTVKVIQQVTRYIAQQADERGAGHSLDACLAEALGVLGLAGRPDPYGLAAKALKGL